MTDSSALLMTESTSCKGKNSILWFQPWSLLHTLWLQIMSPAQDGSTCFIFDSGREWRQAGMSVIAQDPLFGVQIWGWKIHHKTYLSSTEKQKKTKCRRRRPPNIHAASRLRPKRGMGGTEHVLSTRSCLHCISSHKNVMTVSKVRLTHITNSVGPGFSI